MHFRCKRRIIALAVLFAFALSIGLQGLTATLASAAAVASQSAMPMSSADDPMDCPTADGLDQANCMAMCASFIAVLVEPVRLPLLRSHQTLRSMRMPLLNARSVLPEPYPPKPGALI